MNKERLVAFCDAVLAIIMTILVLELEKPASVSLINLWELRYSFLSYTISFFWLGIMWVNMHNGWHDVQKISNKVVWSTLFLLFFSSFFPYITSLVAQNFMNKSAQVFYAIIVLLVTLCNMLMYHSLAEISVNTAMQDFMKEMHWLKYDIIIKISGLVIGITIYPPAVLISILINMCAFVVIHYKLIKKEQSILTR